MSDAASFEFTVREMVGLNNLRSRAPHALARAVNRSAKSARTAMVKAVREDVGGLKAADVRSQVKLQEARPSLRPEARLRISKRRLSLIKFGGTQLKRAGWRPRLKGGSGTIAGAFKARMRSGHVGVYKRVPYPATDRLPIRELKGPSLAKPFAKHWGTVGRARYREQMQKNMAHELRFAHNGR